MTYLEAVRARTICVYLTQQNLPCLSEEIPIAVRSTYLDSQVLQVCTCKTVCQPEDPLL